MRVSGPARSSPPSPTRYPLPPKRGTEARESRCCRRPPFPQPDARHFAGLDRMADGNCRAARIEQWRVQAGAGRAQHDRKPRAGRASRGNHHVGRSHREARRDQKGDHVRRRARRSTQREAADRHGRIGREVTAGDRRQTHRREARQPGCSVDDRRNHRGLAHQVVVRVFVRSQKTRSRVRGDADEDGAPVGRRCC